MVKHRRLQPILARLILQLPQNPWTGRKPPDLAEVFTGAASEPRPSASVTLVVSMRPAYSNIFFGVLATALLAGCGAPGIPIPPSLELAKPVTDLRAVRKGDNVYLAWSVPVETTERRAIRRPGPTRVCRSVGDTIAQCEAPVGEISPARVTPPAPSPAKKKDGTTAPRLTAGYRETLPLALQAQSHDQVTYAVEVLNASQRSGGLSNLVQVPAAPALPPPAGFQAQVTTDGVLLSWSEVPLPSETPGLRYVYRVYRREKESTTSALAGEIPLENPTALQLVDHGFEWEHTYSYRAAVVTLIARDGKPELQVEGEDTPTVTVFAHDVFPPAVPSGLQAVFSGVGQAPFVDLVWAPDTEADLAGYNIFRHPEGGQPVKINSELVKAPNYRDAAVQSGKTYFYSVSAVDVRGNESAKSEEANEAVP